MLTRTQGSSPCTPALSPPSHGRGATTQPSLFPPGKASPSPWSVSPPAAGPHSRTMHTGSQCRQRARAALLRMAPAAPRHAHTSTGCWPGAGCLETSARKEPPVNDLVNLDIRTYKYLQRKLLEGLCASGAALPARCPASEHRQLPTVLPLRLANTRAAQHKSPAREGSSPDRDLCRGILLTQLGQAAASAEQARFIRATWR